MSEKYENPSNPENLEEITKCLICGSKVKVGLYCDECYNRIENEKTIFKISPADSVKIDLRDKVIRILNKKGYSKDSWDSTMPWDEYVDQIVNNMENQVETEKEKD